MRQKTMKGMAALAFVLLLMLGLAAWSTPASAIVQAAAPANLSGTAGAGAATITWSNVGTNKSFTIQSASFVSGVKSYTAAGTATSLNVTGLKTGNTYYFRIRALTSTGAYSAWSKPISVTP